MELQGQVAHSNTAEIIIRCEGITKRFPKKNGESFLVLDDINISVKENEFVVLLGPGQCGKTTMINIVAGLDQPTSGSVSLNGKTVDKPGKERGVVYQEICLFPWLTVMENVEFGPKACGVPKEERRKQAQYFIDLVGLQGFENQHPNKLSGGMKQRVGIARAYCNNPVVMLMDEPFGHLDAQTRYLMQQELGKIHQNEQRTVIFVTNNIEEAIFLADRIILMTNCPTKINREFEVNMPRPRDYVDPEFLRLRKEITREFDPSL